MKVIGKIYSRICVQQQVDSFKITFRFHGKGPGKKQIEKRQAKQEKKELMKKMNSMDTPLGTLQKQLKKQEALQAPYIILSGSGRDTGYVVLILTY